MYAMAGDDRVVSLFLSSLYSQRPFPVGCRHIAEAKKCKKSDLCETVRFKRTNPRKIASPEPKAVAMFEQTLPENSGNSEDKLPSSTVNPMSTGKIPAQGFEFAQILQ